MRSLDDIWRFGSKKKKKKVPYGWVDFLSSTQPEANQFFFGLIFIIMKY
jgi:hypothetical protein